MYIYTEKEQIKTTVFQVKIFIKLLANNVYQHRLQLMFIKVLELKSGGISLVRTGSCIAC